MKNICYLSRYSVLYLLLAILMLAGCREKQRLFYQGYVEGEYVYVASSLPGRIEKLMVQRGQSVEPATPMFALEALEESKALLRAEQDLAAQTATLHNLQQGKRPRELDVIRAQLAAARIAAEHSEKQRHRHEKLIKHNAVSREQLDDTQSSHAANTQKIKELTALLDVAELPAREGEIAYQVAMVKRAESTLAEARWRLAQKMPTAPAGSAPWYLVVDTLFQEGEWVAAGRPVVKLLAPDKVKVRFFVSEQVVNTLHLGQNIRVRLTGQDEAVPCRITFIGEEAEYTPPVIYSNDTREKMIFLVEAHPEPVLSEHHVPPGGKTTALPGRLRPGQPVAVELP